MESARRASALHEKRTGRALRITEADVINEEMYEEINADIMNEYLPAIPISHSPPALVVSKNVQGLVPSPLTAEDFNSVSKS